MFMGSGTTLYECETLKRNVIAFDINPEIIDFVKRKMEDTTDIKYFIHNCDVANAEGVQECLSKDLSILGKKSFDHIIIYAPYLDIIRFTDLP